MSPSLLILLALIQASKSANILGVVLHPSFSHQVVFRPIWKQLSLRGHNVTLLTTDPMRDPALTNLTEIDLSFVYDIWKSSGIIEFSRKEGMAKFFLASLGVAEKIMRAQMEVPEVKDLLVNPNGTFDLVIVEPIYTVGLGFAERFKCPLVFVLSTDAHGWFHRLFGNPSHTVAYPAIFLPFSNPRTIWERFLCLIYYYVEEIFANYSHKQTNRILKEYFGEDTPLTQEISDRASLLVSNVNPALATIRPTVPAVISFGGGFHLEEPKPLSARLQNFLDNATEGVVYFSLGSNVFSANIENDKLTTLMEVFAELPFKVLWKFEGETIDGKPENVHLFKWLPQVDVLRHPNVKVFVTQGGLQSLEEALYANVPVVGMPQVADQFFNVKRAVDRGIGVEVNFKKLQKQKFKEAILEVAGNPTYRERMRQLVDFAEDQPMKNLDRVIWWIEYVIRHNGTAMNLRASDVNVPFFRYYNIDVIAVLLALLSIIVFLTKQMFLYLSNHSKFVKIKNK